ncbi:hypothetical protein AGRA3207_003593 [Actinomadura graeca]|uniref:PH domain-containing protein n=1 Tax=Actinomadura graeca TaxID=2750812 RepID=A0ABX8QUZ4_9ACTN|nr:hypothetical protein [Actinomadura graeca]QXJ22573.1 hypothetical protein AGRA3207_003593 [Actinomadura graeca]
MTAPGFPGAGPTSIYTGRATSWPVVIVSAVLLLPLLILGGGPNGSWWDLAPILISVTGVALYALTGSSVRLAAGPNGASVRFGALGWPRRTYHLDQIQRAEVIDLHPLYVAFGFWWTPRRTCYTVRSGPTLRLRLNNGRTVTVTTPHPHTAATAINNAKASPSARK